MNKPSLMSGPPFMVIVAALWAISLFFLSGLAMYKGLGLFLVIAGFLCALRIMWLWEPFLKHGKGGSVTSAPKGVKRVLPWVVLSVMEVKRRKELSEKTLKMYTPDLLAICASIFLYILLLVVAFCFVENASELDGINTSISFYFQGDKDVFFSPDRHSILLAPSFVALNGMFVWLILTYTFEDRLVDLGLWVLSILFVVSFFTNIIVSSPVEIFSLKGLSFFGHGSEMISFLERINDSIYYSSFHKRLMNSGILGAGLIYGAGFVVFLKLLICAWRIDRRFLYAVGGLFVLLLMVACDLFISQSFRLFPVWLSGWGIIATLWHRCSLRRKKRYVMRQV